MKKSHILIAIICLSILNVDAKLFSSAPTPKEVFQSVKSIPAIDFQA